MKGLLQKDIYNLLQQGKSMLYVFFSFTIVFIPQGKTNFFVPMWVMVCTMLVITAMSLDSAAKWNIYALTMPVTRKELVKSKYILAVLLALFGVISSGFVLGISYLILKNVEWKEAVILLGIVLGIGFLYLSFILPLLFKFGVEKARIFLMLGYLVPLIFGYGIVFLAKKFQITMPDERMLEELIIKGAIALPIIGIICLGISSSISIRIFQKTENI